MGKWHVPHCRKSPPRGSYYAKFKYIRPTPPDHLKGEAKEARACATTEQWVVFNVLILTHQEI